MLLQLELPHHTLILPAMNMDVPVFLHLTEDVALDTDMTDGAEHVEK